MAVYLKEFENHTQYENYINGSGAILPNVSLCTTEGDVHYNPYTPPTPVETRVVAKYNVTDISNPTRIASATTGFNLIEIDGIEQPSVTTGYTFDTIGEHIVKYTLTDPASISQKSFSGCTSLTSIDIPDSVTSIGQQAFQKCSGLTSIDIPDSVTSIGWGAFDNCSSLTSIEIPSGVTSIGNSAFNGCSSLTRLNSNVDGVFNIPSGVTSIGSMAFNSCSGLTSINIPSGVTSLSDMVFRNCSGLTSIDIPNSVTTIGSYTFSSCTSLNSCTIGSGVTSIDEGAFRDCSGLTSITVNATTPPIMNRGYVFVNTNDCPIYVPSDSVEAYKAASQWSPYVSRIQAIP